MWEENLAYVPFPMIMRCLIQTQVTADVEGKVSLVRALLWFDAIHAWPIYLEAGWYDPIGLDDGISITWGWVCMRLFFNLGPASEKVFFLKFHHHLAQQRHNPKMKRDTCNQFKWLFRDTAVLPSLGKRCYIRLFGWRVKQTPREKNFPVARTRCKCLGGVFSHPKDPDTYAIYLQLLTCDILIRITVQNAKGSRIFFGAQLWLPGRK